MQRISKKAKERIANNIVAFMVDDVSLLPETISFIYNWVRQPEGTGRSKSYYEVWDTVLQNYLPKERPVLFRSCKRLSNRTIQSFTGSIYAAERFSEGHLGHMITGTFNKLLSVSIAEKKIIICFMLSVFQELFNNVNHCTIKRN